MSRFALGAAILLIAACDATSPTLTVAGTGFLLGARHGLDWDHIAAITDLTAAGSPGQNEDEGVRGHGRGLGLALAH